MSIQALGAGLESQSNYNPNQMIELQRLRETHYVISLMQDNDWKGGENNVWPGQQNRRLNRLTFPRCRIVPIDTISYPTRNTFQSMDPKDTAPEMIMYEKLAGEQVEEIVKGFDGFGIYNLDMLVGFNKRSVILIEQAVLPGSTDEKDYTYPALKAYFNSKQVHDNIFALANDVLEVAAEKVRQQLLHNLENAKQIATLRIASSDNEIGRAKAGRGGKFGYDEVDIVTMKFLSVKAKFEVAPETGLTQEPNVQVIDINKGGDQALLLEIAALRQETMQMKVELAQSKAAPTQPTEVREMKRCKACATDVFKEAAICYQCKLNPDKKPS